MGAPAIAALIAHGAFWGLLVYGYAMDELRPRGIVIFLLVWCAGLVGLPYVSYEPARGMFPSFVAVLDVALVLIIAKGDVRLT